MNRNRKVKMLLLILLLICCVHTYAQCRFIKTPVLNGWSITRLGASAGSYGICRAFRLKPVPALITTIAIGVVWEIYFDGFRNKIPFNIFPPDPGGADLLGDVVTTGIGACLGLITEAAIKLLTGKKGKVYIHENKAYLVIPL